jgi:hypothetical protein
MAISLVRRLDPWWFTPKSQNGAPAPSRFLLAPLSQQQLLEVKYLIFREGRTPQERAEGHRLAAHYAICGWENVTGTDGKPATFQFHLVSDLPTNLIVEIGTEVVNRNMLAEHEVKNSESPSTSGNGQASSPAENATADAARTASGEAPSPESGSSKASDSKPVTASPSR